MAGEPTIIVVGNLTDGPELRYMSPGMPVTSFIIAPTPRTFNR